MTDQLIDKSFQLYIEVPAAFWDPNEHLTTTCSVKSSSAKTCFPTSDQIWKQHKVDLQPQTEVTVPPSPFDWRMTFPSKSPLYTWSHPETDEPAFLFPELGKTTRSCSTDEAFVLRVCTQWGPSDCDRFNGNVDQDRPEPPTPSTNLLQVSSQTCTLRGHLTDSDTANTHDLQSWLDTKLSSFLPCFVCVSKYLQGWKYIYSSTVVHCSF